MVVMYPMRRILAPLMSKYSVSSTSEMPTTFTVMTKHTASFREFHTNRGMLPAIKNRMTFRGSLTPPVFSLKMLVNVFRQGTSMNPRKK